MNVYDIPAGAPFLDAIATGWLGRAGADPLARAEGLILLPTRRAARALAEAFLRASDGAPLLLPRITAIGALDEAPLALAGALDLPPAVAPARRLAELSRLILALDGAFGAPRTADRAWLLAGELALLMDEAERAEIDLAKRLPHAASADFAAHWEETLRFLQIVTRTWPDWLAQEVQMNPVARQVALLDAQALAWKAAPPSYPVLAAGLTGATPAIARLLAVIAGLPAGAIVLPGLDRSLDAEAWDTLDPVHPQAGIARLLARVGARREEVRNWPGCDAPAPRAALLSRALLPAGSLAAWRTSEPASLDGLQRIDPADQQEEATAIALVLREALETPGQRAALVTPDRALARRTALELARFGVDADDSAGETLAETPPAVFLRLLAVTLAEGLAPVSLLALLKHPLAAAGIAPASCRAAARALERQCLRGPKPRTGPAGLRRAAARGTEGGRIEADAFIGRIEACLAPALRVFAAVVAPPAVLLGALIEAAEALAATDELPGPARLWEGEDGNALAEALAVALETLPVLPDQRPRTLSGLLDALLQGAVVRGRRSHGSFEHPRIYIWGLLEARLQSSELIVLGGLTEGTWPPATDPGPWLSRPMRAAIGLPAPEEAIGEAAHDFVSAACSAPRVVLSVPRRRDGAPAVPSRWLVRLDAFLRGAGMAIPRHPALSWARALDLPVGAPVPATPPMPRPPVALRPRALSVTEIETWRRDPYAIYARHILGLRPLDPLEQPTDAADYGSIVHAALHDFLRRFPTDLPADTGLALRAAMQRALEAAELRPALAAWWRPRLARIANWVAEAERARRAADPPRIFSELKGSWDIDRPGGNFRLTGRADRIERHAAGLAVLDYKTGTPPSFSEVKRGLAPQLPLEAAMAAAGAFGPDLRADTFELVYWQLGGGIDPGKEIVIDPGEVATLVTEEERRLRAWIDAFDQVTQPYLSHPHPGHQPRFAEFAQLARVAEWQAGRE